MKKYTAYFRNGDYKKQSIDSDNLSELIQAIIENGVPVHDYPEHYLSSLLKKDSETEDGCICSWGNLEIEKGICGDTDYTLL